MQYKKNWCNISSFAGTDSAIVIKWLTQKVEGMEFSMAEKDNKNIR